MTPEQSEAFARFLCEIIRADPDEIVPGPKEFVKIPGSHIMPFQPVGTELRWKAAERIAWTLIIKPDQQP